ncbi:hypothetical protein RIF29_42421 [Crotalaria pallida]|uniref:Transmembrane protein n=1 Tax=Crotalaria pallida TaxID=3830 RepID=A0AAN9ECU6_CROPI
MADYETNQTTVSKETALQALNTIIQLHFEKTLEKKHAIDLQKKELHKLFQFFFIFLTLVFLALSQSSPPRRLRCSHCWMPVMLLSIAHLMFYVSVAQTLRCVNGFKYQKRCHKLTLALATEKLREIKIRLSEYDGAVGEDEFEIHYQEPPESYFGKFKRNWALHFGFLVFTYGFMVSSSVVLICF